MNNRACYTRCLHNANNACAYGSVNDIATCPYRQTEAKPAPVDPVSGLVPKYPRPAVDGAVLINNDGGNDDYWTPDGKLDLYASFPDGEIKHAPANYTATAARAMGLPIQGEDLAEGEEAWTWARLDAIQTDPYYYVASELWQCSHTIISMFGLDNLRRWKFGWIVRRIPAQAKPAPSGVCHNHGCASQHDDKCSDDGSHFDPARCTSRVTAKAAPESCPHCEGKGKWPSGMRPDVDSVCHVCHGTGIKPAPESAEARLTPGELAEIQTLADKLAEDYCKAISPLVYKVINDTLAAKDTEITRLRGACEAAKNLYDSAHWIAEGMDMVEAGLLWRNLRDTLHAAGIYVISDGVSQADKP